MLSTFLLSFFLYLTDPFYQEDLPALSLQYHARVPIPFDPSTREGFFVFSRMDLLDASVFPTADSLPSSPQDSATSIPPKHHRTVVGLFLLFTLEIIS